MALCLWLSFLWAQFPYTHTPPQVSWRSSQSQHFEIVYGVGYEELAYQTALYAEDMWYEMRDFFDYTPARGFMLWAHPHAYSYYERPSEYRGGLLAPELRRQDVFFPGTQKDFVRLVRAKVALLFLRDMFYGDGTNNLYQSRSLLYLPAWYLEGLSAFLGEGWLAENVLQLSSLSAKQVESFFEVSSFYRPTYRLLAKSFWYYLYRTYGAKKIADFVYMTRLARSVEVACLATFNKDPQELGEAWHGFIIEKFSTSGEERGYERVGRLRNLVAVALSPDKTWFAFIRQTRNAYEYGLYNLTEDKGYTLPLTQRFARDAMPMPPLQVGWASPTHVLYTQYDPKGLRLWLYDLQGGSLDEWPVDLSGVQSITPAKEGIFYLAGWRNAQNDIYVGDLKRKSLRLMQPSTPQDEIDVAFLSGKLSYVEGVDSAGKAPFERFLIPYRLRVGEEVVYQDGLSGVRHPFALDTLVWGCFEWVGSYALAGWKTDTLYTWQMPRGYARALGKEGQTLWFLGYSRGYLEVGKLLIQQPHPLYPSPMAIDVIQLQMQQQGRYRSKPPSPSEPRDTFAPDTLRKRFYVFDEEEKPPRTLLRRRSTGSPLPEKPSFSPDSVKLKPFPASSYRAQLVDIGAQVQIHPLMRLSVGPYFAAGIKNHTYLLRMRFMPYWDLRSSEMTASWEKRTGTLQPMITFGRQTHVFRAPRYAYFAKLTTVEAAPALRFVFPPSAAVTAGIKYLFHERYDMDKRDFLDLNEKQTLMGVFTSWAWEKVDYRENMAWKGWRLAGQLEIYRYQNEFIYPLFRMNFSRYQPITQKARLHLIARAAASGTQSPQLTSLGGVPNWVNYVFQGRNAFPFPARSIGYYFYRYEDIPGFPYNSRSGRYFLALGGDLAVPFLAWSSPHLIFERRYSLSLHLFYHIATAWNTGNPFSQKNPIDAEFIYKPPLVITVQGLRSPFLISFGGGIEFRIVRIPVRLDVAWPIEDNALGRPIPLIYLYPPW
ncbi:MAG: BamA/TamA family outer membrane protein [Bacteroidia bacterium]